MYKEIKSKFIKEKIKRTRWKDRKYIDNLIKIEKLALGKNFGLVTGYIEINLREDYPKEWEIIYKEVNPKGYEKMIKREKEEKEREEKEQKEFEEECRKEQEQLKKEWKEMGGK